MDKHIAKAIVEVALFLKSSPESIIDADASIEALEQLAANLQLASSAEKLALSQHFAAMASDYGEHGEVVFNLREFLGLDEN